VHPTLAIEIFGNVSTPFGTLAMSDLSIKMLWRSSQGNPSVGGVKHKRDSDFGPIERYIYISRKRCKIGAKLVLITNEKLYMSFRLVPNSVTLDNHERRNSHNRRVISPNSIAFGTNYVKLVEDTKIHSAAEM